MKTQSAQHTPRPWRWIGDTLTSGTDDILVAQWADDVNGNRPTGTKTAFVSAHKSIIAATPDLLDACRELIERFAPDLILSANRRAAGKSVSKYRAAQLDALARARAAIAKATKP